MVLPLVAVLVKDIAEDVNEDAIEDKIKDAALSDQAPAPVETAIPKAADEKQGGAA